MQPNHPESPLRLEAIMSLLEQEEVLDRLVAVPFATTTTEQLAKIHDLAYVTALEKLSVRGGGMLGPDTYVNRQTYRVAALAAGASVAAVDAVLGGELRRTFALVRPPGHHAFANHGEGFCIFNNIAFAALAALGDLGDRGYAALERVMIVDWDVHHGNGTQDIFYEDPRVLYISTHQFPLYPGTGRMTETGAGPGEGTNVNIPLPPGVGDNGYMRVCDEIIVPMARQFRPQLMLISAGYDAHWRDTLAHMRLSLDGLTQFAAAMARLSDELCASRMVALLEGGYDLEVLSYGVLNTLYVMDGEPERAADPIGPARTVETPVDQIIRRVRQIHSL